MTAPEQSVALYAHAGSGNHGCEALACTLIRQLSDSGISPVRLLTNSREEDMRYLLALGADCIMSDYPDKLFALRQEMGK